MSLRYIGLLWWKELRSIFLSPLIYVLTALFCLLIGWLFFNYIILSKELFSATLTQTVLVPVFGNMNFIFLFLAPLLSMGSLAAEKQNGSLELLEMSRLSVVDIVLGKYLALLSVALFMLLFTIVFPLVLHLSGYNDWGIVLTNYLGIFLSVGAYLAVGLFASSLSSNQLIAALSAFAILMVLLLLALSVNATGNLYLGNFFRYLSIPYHFEKFSTGALVSYSGVYFASFISFFLLLVGCRLSARKW